MKPGNYSRAWTKTGKVVYDPEREKTFEEQWFDEFERDRWEKAVENAYKKLRKCRYVKGLEQ